MGRQTTVEVMVEAVAEAVVEVEAMAEVGMK